MKITGSLYPHSQNYSGISRLRQQLDSLQMQFSSGKKVNALSEFGDKRSFDISLRNRLNKLEGYSNTMDMVGLRLSFLNQAMGRFDQIESDARANAIPSGTGSNGINLEVAPSTAKSQLEEVVMLLNSEVNGRYLFAGNKTDAKPVASLSAILDGEGGRDGFRAVLSERKAADAGVDGRGRLAASTLGAVTTLSEDGVHPFGMKLSGVSTDSGSVAVTSPAGSPQSLTVDFTAQPTEGQSVHITLTLPDGSTTTASFKAVSGTPADSSEFAIGATGGDTAASFQSALQAKLAEIGGTELAASSTFAAADNFFNGRGETVVRVDGVPPETATATIAATDTDTISWYMGQDFAGNPRQSVTGKVDDSTQVGYGVQANEDGFVQLVRSLASMAAESFPSGDATSGDRYNAIADIQTQRLAETNNSKAGSIEVITLELGNAEATIGNVRERQAAYKVQLDTMLADIEQAPIEEVAAQILSLQTRLQASYETMAMISQLSMVNYLR